MYSKAFYIEVCGNSSAQDFALAAKSMRMRKFSRRIQPFANSKL